MEITWPSYICSLGQRPTVHCIILLRNFTIFLELKLLFILYNIYSLTNKQNRSIKSLINISMSLLMNSRVIGTTFYSEQSFSTTTIYTLLYSNLYFFLPLNICYTCGLSHIKWSQSRRVSQNS